MSLLTFFLVFGPIVGLIIYYTPERQKQLQIKKQINNRIRKNQRTLRTYGQTLTSIFSRDIYYFQTMHIEALPQDILMMYSISLFVLSSLGLLLLKNHAGALLGLLGLILPRLILRHLHHKRVANFEKFFPEALSLMASSLRSGFALERCLQLLETEMPQPVCSEFAYINKNLRLGSSMAETLKSLELRIPIPQVELFATAILIQQEVGGSLSEIVSSLAETIRKDKEIRRELKVLTAQGRSTAMIVGLMPILLLLAVRAMNAEYVAPLFTTTLGHFILMGSAGFEILALFVISQLVKLD